MDGDYIVRQCTVTSTDLIMGEVHTQSASCIAERVQQWEKKSYTHLSQLK